MTIAIAGAMTGADLARVEQLPDTAGMNNEVPILRGHMVYYGAPVEQAIRLAGATPVAVGGATRAQAYQLEGALNERSAAAPQARVSVPPSTRRTARRRAGACESPHT